MLSDEIAATDWATIKRYAAEAGAPDGGDLLAGIMSKTYGWWTQALRNSQRFVLDANVTSAINDVAQGRPSSILEAKDYIRLPFDECWFEWPESARKGQQFDLVIGDAMNRQGTVRRMGFLCKQESDGTIKVQMAWQAHSKSDIIQTSPFIMVWNQTSQMRLENTDEELHAMRPEVAKKEFEAVRIIGGWIAMELSSFQAQAYPEASRKRFKQSVLQNMNTFKSDWAGEARFFAALLIMLNTKNGVEIRSSDMATLNKARVKSGKLPLYEHRVVQLRRSARERNAASGNSGGVTPRAHLVRGHFKIRASGVFWWSRFVRGDARNGIVTHEYRVGE